MGDRKRLRTTKAIESCISKRHNKGILKHFCSLIQAHRIECESSIRLFKGASSIVDDIDRPVWVGTGNAALIP